MSGETDKRPWGKYEVLLDHELTKVKIITVKPQGKLSYQYHHKRRNNGPWFWNTNRCFRW